MAGTLGDLFASFPDDTPVTIVGDEPDQTVTLGTIAELRAEADAADVELADYINEQVEAEFGPGYAPASAVAAPRDADVDELADVVRLMHTEDVDAEGDEIARTFLGHLADATPQDQLTLAMHICHAILVDEEEIPPFAVATILARLACQVAVDHGLVKPGIAGDPFANAVGAYDRGERASDTLRPFAPRNDSPFRNRRARKGADFTA